MCRSLSAGGRDVVLEHVDTTRTEVELAALMQVARRRLNPGQDELDLGLTPGREGTSSTPAVITGKHSALLWQVLTEVYARLGFDAIGDEAFKELVLARLIEPTSILSRATAVCHSGWCPREALIFGAH